MPYIPGSLIALLGGGRVLQKFLAKEDKKNYEELPYMRRLIMRLGWEDDFSAFRKEHPNYGEYKAFRKFFTTERIEFAKEQEKKWEESDKYWAEEMKKTYTLKRIFAYQYEDFLFSLFAPLALYDDYEKKWDFIPAISTPEGVKGVIIHLPEDYVIYRIAKEYNLSEEDAHSRFKELVDNWCIHFNNIGHWCELGSVLTTHAGVVSANDMNISKWIELHGQTITREQLLAESEPFKYVSPNNDDDNVDFFGDID